MVADAIARGSRDITAILAAWSGVKDKKILGDVDEDGVNLRAQFERYDVDRNGYIDRSEFAGLLKDLGSRSVGWKLEDAFAEMDLDASGKITFDEFARCGGVQCCSSAALCHMPVCTP